MLFAGSPEQAAAALRGMRDVATAGDAHPLSDADGRCPDWRTPTA